MVGSTAVSVAGMGPSRALVSQPNLPLPDEPANHLAIDAVARPESFLSDHRGAVVFVTHDRAFLRRLATRIAST